VTSLSSATRFALFVGLLTVPLACGRDAAPPARSVALTSAHDAAAVLAAVKLAAGGARWDALGTVRLEGEVIADALDGTFVRVASLGDGRFAYRYKNAIFASGDGFDGRARWHQDASGQTHPFDSDEARAVTAAEIYLARAGYYFPERAPARLVRLPDANEGSRTWLRVEATPAGGRAVTLWIDATTRRLGRATMELSTATWTMEYDDYRSVGGVALPFTLRERVADGPAETFAVRGYDVSAPASELELAPPPSEVRDARIVTGARTATSPLRLEAGRLLVDARIDGKGPFPFLLDTGGHAILTPSMVSQLGLTAGGHGTSRGAGAGATAIQYTRVTTVDLGDARLENQPFLVLPYPFPTIERGTGTPIAGLIGLELFERFVVALDYDEGTLTLSPFDAAPPERPGVAVPLTFTDDMPLAHAQLDGHDGVFGIDTGNGGDVVVFAPWAIASGVRDRYRAGLAMVSLGVGGLSTNYLARAQSFAIGGVLVSRIAARLAEDSAGSFASRSEAGNIGQSVLARFNVVFDYRRATMWLTARREVEIPPSSRGGFSAMKTDPHVFTVLAIARGGPAESAGLLGGDVIVAVDGTPSEQLGGADMYRKVRQAAGAVLRLTVKRDGAPREVSLTLRDLL
jgi:Aspartyl protease/PDZ domain